jgi:hypothetical protein
MIDSIEIPASVENIKGFYQSSLSQLIFAPRTTIKEIKVQGINRDLSKRSPRLFAVYDEQDLRKSRRWLNVL